jgi:hypothetical protein
LVNSDCISGYCQSNTCSIQPPVFSGNPTKTVRTYCAFKTLIALPDGTIGCSGGPPGADHTDFWTYSISDGSIKPLKQMKKANLEDPGSSVLLSNGWIGLGSGESGVTLAGI